MMVCVPVGTPLAGSLPEAATSVRQIDPGAASDRAEMGKRVKQEVEQMGEGRKPIPPKRMPDLDDVADITSGGTPTGTGVSGNEVPPVELPQTASDDDLDEDEEVLA